MARVVFDNTTVYIVSLLGLIVITTIERIAFASRKKYIVSIRKKIERGKQLLWQ